MILIIEKMELVGKDPMMQFVSFDPSNSNTVNPMPAGKRGVSSMKSDTPACICMYLSKDHLLKVLGRVIMNWLYPGIPEKCIVVYSLIISEWLSDMMLFQYFTLHSVNR